MIRTASIPTAGLPASAIPPAIYAAGTELAQPARPQGISLPPARPAAEKTGPSAAPVRPPASIPAEADPEKAEPAANPDDDEEVSPGDDPASCDGCELAGFSWAGTLWGLFGVSRRRGIPRAVIRGLQPR